jgi:CubicO group peptidase (beta-lactamase class C family)
MRIILISIAAIIALFVAGFAFVQLKVNNIKDNKDLQATIDKLANKYVADGKALGLVIGVVKNDTVYSNGYGTIRKGQSILPDSNSIFELASTSKLFTTSVLQLMADDGTLQITDKIQPFLKGKVSLHSLAQNTSLQHLATHLSGFPSLPNSFLAKMNDETNPYKDLVTQDIYDYLKKCEGKQPDGTFEYSNFGMGLLGHILELKSGIKYEELVKQKLLLPLQMKNTFVTVTPENKKMIAQGYDENNNEAPIWKDDVLTGAGSFLSSGADMIQFVKANLKSKATSISTSLLQTHQQQLGGENGLGWILPSSTDTLLGNKSIIWHNGMAGGYASFICIDKTNNYGLFVLSNKAVDVTKLGMKLTIAVRTQSWRK